MDFVTVVLTMSARLEESGCSPHLCNGGEGQGIWLSIASGRYRKANLHNIMVSPNVKLDLPVPMRIASDFASQNLNCHP